MIAQLISKGLLRIFGWKVMGSTILKTWDKSVLVVAPHTSNWDFILALVVRKAYDFDSKFLGKASLFRPPFGGIFRWLGGYPVNRQKKSDIVQQSIQIFDQHDRFILALSPEGTRGGNGKFRSGFYHIARGANAQIILVTFDYGKKQVRFENCFALTGNSEEDIPKIEKYFEGVQGKNAPSIVSSKMMCFL